LLTYRVRLDVPRELVLFVSRLLARHRKEIGTRKNSRSLGCYRQALFVLAWYRDKTDIPRLGAGFGLSQATSYRYVAEGTKVIAAEAPGLEEALERAMREGTPYVILDDQALIAHVAGRGLVVLTGCGHAGIINICRYAQRLTGVENLHAIIGGFHLTGPLFEPVIGDTVTALEQLAPEVIVPAHCTGWKATHAIARRLPGAFIQNSVGTTFHLTATAAA